MASHVCVGEHRLAAVVDGHVVQQAQAPRSVGRALQELYQLGDQPRLHHLSPAPRMQRGSRVGGRASYTPLYKIEERMEE